MMTEKRRGSCRACLHWPIFSPLPRAQRCRKNPQGPVRDIDDFCNGGFEPPEGRVCGTCENQIPSDGKETQPTCRAEMLTHAHDLASCGVAWRWGGKERTVGG